MVIFNSCVKYMVANIISHLDYEFFFLNILHKK